MELDELSSLPVDGGGRCPDAERVAMFLEGRLEPDSRLEVERHLAECPNCRHVLAEASEFMTVFPVHDVAPLPRHRVLTIVRRRWPAMAVAGAIAAALVLAARLDLFAPRSEFTRTELLALATALEVGGIRPVEGRLAGGYAYAPPPPTTRGDLDRPVPPDVQIAAATIEKEAMASDTPQLRAALGVAYLVRGDLDNAIESLNEAITLDPGNAAYQVDVAAAYLARARSASGSEADWTAALAAANRALALGGGHEARFNRAMALEGARLRQQAIEAWTEYRERDAESGWSSEAERHLRTLRSGSSGGTPLDHQVTRERVEHVLLRDWGAAVTTGDSQKADTALVEAESLATAMVDRGGDGMAIDAIRRIRTLTSRGDARTLARLARGHLLYGQAREALQKDEQASAVGLMSDAATQFRAVNSPYALWLPIFRAILFRNQGRFADALTELARVPDTLPGNYLHIRARREWGQGVVLDEQGRYDLGLLHLQRAVGLFRDSSERYNLATTQTILAEAEWVLGDHRRAWKDVFAVLEDVDRGNLRPNFYHLAIAGRLAMSANQPEAALEFESARIEAVTSPRSQAESFMRRARTLALLGDYRAAESDLDHARAAVDRLSDDALRKRIGADISISRAELLSHVDSHRAIEEANVALRDVPTLDPAMRLAQLLALRARAYEAQGNVADARADLVASIEQFEGKRASFASADDRLRAFDGERPAFKQLVRLEAVSSGDAVAALKIAERARLGGWRRDVVALDPGVDYTRLPAGTAVVFFEVLDDRVLTWTLTNEGVTPTWREITRDAVEIDVRRIELAIERGAAASALQPLSRRIVGELLTPALKAAGSRSTVFIVPDGPLVRVPFHALPDAAGRPLLTSLNIGVGTSFTELVQGMSGLDDFKADDVLAVGDGHNPETTGLPMLPLADEEARAVGGLYPKRTVLTGGSALRPRMIADERAVLHFAGHTVVNREFPLLSRLLLAPGSSGTGDGALLVSDLLEHRFARTRVAVLATCDAAAARVIDGDGVVTVARAFLAAGVPSVVASLWPVDDDTRDLMTAFHRELRASGRPVQSLRAAQLSLLRRMGAETPVRTWGGFVAFGGMTAG